MQFMVANGTSGAGSNRTSSNRSAARSHKTSSQTSRREKLAGSPYRSRHEARRIRQQARHYHDCAKIAPHNGKTGGQNAASPPRQPELS
jgi:hypothetical protein